ncbi:efflux RND transporter periplasmic adaptor subunit [Thalassotalea fonticola]|uniref:Efflux RND transporter periplasmic adaptor subunit n=1 Tax=Thalassotalea fonticola TaxID=3065649 RepID=A0ABZ0GLU7_9GAMM|nr:efflux RND transporter periplasmic adaptor subunit [Colwelliaceae bacterium S1-1]
MRILLTILLASVLLGCNEQAVVTEKAIRPIAWSKVSETNLKQLRTLSGVVAPVEATNLSFEVIGKVETVEVQLGEIVIAGQVLAQLNHRSFDLSLQSAQAQLDKANAAMAEAKNTFERYDKLVKQGLVSQSGFDNAKATYDSNKSAVGVAQAQVDIANKNLQDSTLLAPYDGVITKRLIEPSQQIGAGQAAFEVEGNHGFEIEVLVPETLIQELKQDTFLAIRFPVLTGVTMQGRINEIGTRAQSANAFPVTVILAETNNKLRAGMTAEVDFVFDGIGRTGYKGKTIAVPMTALRAGLDQKSYVFVYDIEASVVRLRQVQTENILNNLVYLSSGLSDGEIIATAGVAFLRDGQQVTLLDNSTQRFN